MNDFAKLLSWNLVPERTYDVAFLCWLIDSINRPDEEPGIKKAACNLLDMILQEEKSERYTSVDIIRGYKGVAAIAVVNDSLAVILETGLIRTELLKNVASAKLGLTKGQFPVFSKIFSSVHAAVFDLHYRESGVGKDEIYDSVDIVISSEDLLSCMCVQPPPSSEMYCEYLMCLQIFSQKSSGYQTRTVAQWDRFCYCGYFSHLEKQLPQRGTGWGFKNTVYGLQRWFCWDVFTDVDAFDLTKLGQNLVRLYYQIEIMDGICELCVQCKAAAKKRIQTELLWKLYYAFSDAFQKKGYDCGKKRFLGGQFTPICSVVFEPSKEKDIVEAANAIYQEVVTKLLSDRNQAPEESQRGEME